MRILERINVFLVPNNAQLVIILLLVQHAMVLSSSSTLEIPIVFACIVCTSINLLSLVETVPWECMDIRQLKYVLPVMPLALLVKLLLSLVHHVLQIDTSMLPQVLVPHHVLILLIQILIEPVLPVPLFVETVFRLLTVRPVVELIIYSTIIVRLLVIRDIKVLLLIHAKCVLLVV